MIPPALAIFAWPFISAALFKRLSLPNALIWCVLGGYLFLPEIVALELPVLPPISKETIPSFSALLLVVYTTQAMRQTTLGRQTPNLDVQPGFLPKNKIMLILLITAVIGAMLTALTNGDRLSTGGSPIPGLRPYDAGSMAMLTFVHFIPLLLARKYLASPDAHRTLLHVFLVAGLIYSLPVLWEVRLSPQLNLQVYGFRAHSFRQHIRNDGFRPMVFLNHGIWVGIFMSCAFVAALAYVKQAATQNRWKYILAAAWLFLSIFVMNSLGALLITTMMLLAILFLPERLRMLLIAGLAGTILFYPMLRGSGVIPTEQAISVAESINPLRADSLKFRLDNEDLLLEKANERPWFGWGGWNRNRVYDEDGQDLTTADGAWIILIGTRGWIGYLAEFGLLCGPLLLLFLRRRFYEPSPATTGLMLVLCANLLDLIPNATLTPLTVLLAGALIGRLEWRSNPAKDLPKEDPTGRPWRSAYPRQSKRHVRTRKINI